MPPRPREVGGIWSDTTIKRFCNEVAGTKGDFAEIGVAFGRVFKKLVPIATAQAKLCHAFDSFVGMGDGGPFDRPGGHPKGQFDVGGVEAFRQLLETAGMPPDRYRLWDGWIPHCFAKYQGSHEFSLVVLDVDNYEPTKLALDWVWTRLARGGELLLDDFEPYEGDLEATKAISEFLRQSTEFEIRDYYNRQLIIRKV